MSIVNEVISNTANVIYFFLHPFPWIVFCSALARIEMSDVALVIYMRCFWGFGTHKKNLKKTYGRVLLLVQFQAACNFTRSNTPLWVFFAFFKLHKWYQIMQRITWKHRISCTRNYERNIHYLPALWLTS